MNCAQVKERLIDHLYDELAPEARASLTEHLNGCPACKAEIASYQHTLDSARVALGGPLLEEPPARVHLAAIQAAQASAKQAAAKKVTGPRDELGFLARLWRAPWFLPAFGAASVATVVFLVRVLKNPEVLPGQRPNAIEERSLGTPDPVPPPEPEPTMAAQPAATPAATAEVNANSDLDEAKQASSAGKADRRGSKGGMARAQAWGRGRGDKRKASEEVQGLGGLRLNEGLDKGLGKGQSGAGTPMQFAEPPPPRPAAKSSKTLDNLSDFSHEEESSQRRAQPQVAPASGKAERASKDADRLEVLAEKVAPPAKKAPQNQPAAEMAKTTNRAATHSGASPAGAAAPATAYAPAPAPSAPSAVMRKKSLRVDDEEAEGSAKSDYDAKAKDKKTKSGDKAGPSLDESVRKAERLYASQDWNSAAAAYRDLLNRFPTYKDAPKWRDRMNESNAAYVRALEAKRKKVQTDDPLSGSMK
ncbi:MAG TPA: zf-HC2 domain-containing protein [Polyangia bacterium]